MVILFGSMDSNCSLNLPSHIHELPLPGPNCRFQYLISYLIKDGNISIQRWYYFIAFLLLMAFYLFFSSSSSFFSFPPLSSSSYLSPSFSLTFFIIKQCILGILQYLLLFYCVFLKYFFGCCQLQRQSEIYNISSCKI